MADFFDKMLVGINKGVNSVSEGSKNMMEKAKINTSISDAEKEKLKIAEQLGIQAYALQQSGVELPEALIPFCEQITARNQMIADLKKRLAEIDAPKETASIPMATANPVGSYCPDCGSPCNTGAKFCPKCGKAL
ncbi:MAG: zinc ribbon domain-containing protein [Clostridia bacterium]|nr:zinc ribbon domain-containing protein [Clostridia bacterium]